MNKIVISIIVLVLIAGGLYFVLNNKITEAPTLINENQVNETGGNMENIISGSTSTTTTETGAVKEFTVTGKNFSFSPSSIKVKKGDKVKITFKNSEGFHDFVVDEFGATTKKAQAPTTEVIEFTADKTGSFEYYCSVGSHRAMGMKGTLIVE